jgi:hypothetical protein
MAHTDSVDPSLFAFSVSKRGHPSTPSYFRNRNLQLKVNVDGY